MGLRSHSKRKHSVQAPCPLLETRSAPVRRTLDELGILPARFYRWYDRYQSGGYEALKGIVKLSETAVSNPQAVAVESCSRDSRLGSELGHSPAT